MASFNRDTEFVKLQFSFRQAGQDTGWDLSKVMVIQLLVLWGNNAQQGTSANLEIRTHVVNLTINQEEFLLGSQGSINLLGFLVAQQVEELDCSKGKGFRGTKEDGLFVQSITIVRDKDGRNVENRSIVWTVSDKHWGSSVPDGVSTSFKSGSDTSIRE